MLSCCPPALQPGSAALLGWLHRALHSVYTHTKGEAAMLSALLLWKECVGECATCLQVHVTQRNLCGSPARACAVSVGGRLYHTRERISLARSWDYRA
jgi:hypothetical protein